MEGIITWLVANGPAVLEVALQIVGLFALIAARTENKTDDRISQCLLDIINFLGCNIGKAKNKE